MSKALLILESLRDVEPERYQWLSYEYSCAISLSKEKLQEKIRRLVNLAANTNDLNAKYNNRDLAQFLTYMQDTANES